MFFVLAIFSISYIVGVSYNSGQKLNEKYFFQDLLSAPVDKIYKWDQSRKIVADEKVSEHNIVDIKGYLDKIESDEDFKLGRKAFYLKDPFSKKRLIKVQAMGSDFVSGAVSAFGGSPPAFVYNKNLFSNTDLDEYHTPIIYIKIKKNNKNRTKEERRKAAKILLFHELGHVHVAQEIIGKSTLKTTLSQGLNYNVLGAVGLDNKLKGEAYFHNRKLFETHSDIMAALAFKIDTGMSDNDFFKKFSSYKNRAVDKTSIKTNGEHQSGMAFVQLFEFMKNNPNVFDNMTLKEVPYFSLIFTLQSGFFYDQKDRLALDVLNNSENFVQRLNHDPEMGLEIVNWIKDLAHFYKSHVSVEKIQGLLDSIDAVEKKVMFRLPPKKIKKREPSLIENTINEMKWPVVFLSKRKSISKEKDMVLKPRKDEGLNKSVLKMYSKLEEVLIQYQINKIPEIHRGVHVPVIFPVVKIENIKISHIKNNSKNIKRN